MNIKPNVDFTLKILNLNEHEKKHAQKLVSSLVWLTKCDLSLEIIHSVYYFYFLFAAEMTLQGCVLFVLMSL